MPYNHGRCRTVGNRPIINVKFVTRIEYFQKISICAVRTSHCTIQIMLIIVMATLNWKPIDNQSISRHCILDFIRRVLSTVSGSSAVRRCVMVQPAARSLAALNARTQSRRQARRVNLGRFFSCTFHHWSNNITILNLNEKDYAAVNPGQLPVSARQLFRPGPFYFSICQAQTAFRPRSARPAGLPARAGLWCKMFRRAHCGPL